MEKYTKHYSTPRIVLDFEKSKGFEFNYYVEGKELNWHDEDLTKPRAGIHSFRGKKVFGEPIDLLASYLNNNQTPEEQAAMIIENTVLKAENEKLQKRLDKAVEDLKSIVGCKVCKNSKCYIRNGCEDCNFDYSGLNEEVGR